jgi:hypothetical protein
VIGNVLLEMAATTWTWVLTRVLCSKSKNDTNGISQLGISSSQRPKSSPWDLSQSDGYEQPVRWILVWLCDPVHTAPAICRPGLGEDSENRAAVSALLEGVGAESQVGVGGVLPMICSHLSGIFLLSA